MAVGDDAYRRAKARRKAHRAVDERQDRLRWWLNEYGHPPTYDALIALRKKTTNGI